MIGELTFAVVGLLFVLAALRAFLSTASQALAVGLGLPTAVVGGIIVAVLGCAVLALPLSTLGTRRSVAWTAGVLAFATLLLGAARTQWLDLLLGATALVSGVCWVTLLHSSRPADRPSPLSLAVPLALAVDFAMRSALGTIALVDLPAVLAVPLIVAGGLVLLACGIAALGPDRAWHAPSWRGAIALLAMPALLFVAETYGLNAAQAAGSAGLGLGPESAGSAELASIVVGTGIALGIAALVPSTRAPRRALACAGLLVGPVLLWAHVPIVSLAGGAFLGGSCVIALSLLLSDEQHAAPTPAKATAFLGLGWIAFAALVAAHTSLFQEPAPVFVAAIACALAVLIAPGGGVALPRLAAAGGAVLVTLVPLVALLLIAPPVETTARPAFRLMTYNVNHGFNADRTVDLDALVDTVAREDPDVLVLFDVTRGWLTAERHDVVEVLASRLRLRYAFAPELGDLHGTALLTRLPITDVQRTRASSGLLPASRPQAALRARVAGVLIVAGRLGDAQLAAEAIRGVSSPALLVASLDGPADGAVSAFTGSGYVDLAVQAGAREPTWPAVQPRERRDQVFGIGIAASQVHTVASAASDHRPLVMNLAVSP